MVFFIYTCTYYYGNLAVFFQFVNAIKAGNYRSHSFLLIKKTFVIAGRKFCFILVGIATELDQKSITVQEGETQIVLRFIYCLERKSLPRLRL
jgi:hypothetical protein